ncbi:MAG: hypothetical protein FWG29_02360 [Treponema sp.]|nr:hypothetical protein [Treponema sp.]
MKKKGNWLGMLVMVLVFGMSVIACASVETKQYGLESNDTIALNLTRDPNVGALFVTHVNGVATGAVYSSSVYGIGGKTVYVNPIYVRLDGNPIIFTILVPVRTGTDSNGKPIIQYKTTELRLTRLADIKAGDVLTLRWMYQTQTFAFMDATGNIVQQTIPEFN